MTTPEAGDIHAKVSMYRISDDLHDCWNNATKCDCSDHIAVSQQFERIRAHSAGKKPAFCRLCTLKLKVIILPRQARDKHSENSKERESCFLAANLVGATGYLGKSWPDLDIAPVGNLGGANALTDDEQRVVMTLWSISRAPIFVGAVRKTHIFFEPFYAKNDHFARQAREKHRKS